MIPPVEHLAVLPILLPLAAGAFMLLFDERYRLFKMVFSMAIVVTLLGIAGALVWMVNMPTGDRWSTMFVYPLGNWPPPFGIVLVVDRLAALMLLVTAVLACATLLFAMARWHKAGPRFYTLFLLLLTGLNGAFLTGDLFNLFVFFEILLAASYGLVLHGSGTARVRAGLHYIPINLVASSLFLIGVSLIYGVTGTLNMADLSRMMPTLEPQSRMLFEAGAAVLGIAFLVKAGMWPLSFWLPTTYAAACSPVAAMFAIMTKVGVYVILRLFLLCFGDEAGASADFGALYYLVTSTFALSAYFLLVELIERGQAAGADVLAVTLEIFGDPEEDIEDEDEEVGVAIPATIAILGGAFVACTALLAGMPPLSGFIAKFAMLSALMNEAGDIPASHWAFVAVLMCSGLATLIAMSRNGIRTLWVPAETEIPRVRAIEAIPVGVLLFLCAAMTVMGGPAMRYMEATAQILYWPSEYARDVLDTVPTGQAGPTPVNRGGVP